MARLVLLNMSMLLLLVAVGSSIAWPYPEPMENTQVIKDALSQHQEKQAVKEDLLRDQVVKEDEKAVANFDELTAEINQAGACGCDLTAYDHGNFGGRSLLLRQQNADFRNDYFNDRIESLKIAGNCQWLLYEHVNFLGQSYILNPGKYPSPYNWGGHGNRISSARVLPPKGKISIVLFQHYSYTGRMLVLTGSNSNLPHLNFNDQLSSFIITGGKWTLYEHTNFQGRHVTLGPGQYSSPGVGGVGNDKISSVKCVY